MNVKFDPIILIVLKYGLEDYFSEINTKKVDFIDMIINELKDHNKTLFETGTKYDFFDKLFQYYKNNNKQSWDAVLDPDIGGIEPIPGFPNEIGGYLKKIRELKGLREEDFYHFNHREEIIHYLFIYLLWHKDILMETLKGTYQVMRRKSMLKTIMEFNIFTGSFELNMNRLNEDPYLKVMEIINSVLKTIMTDVQKLSLRDIEMILNGISTIDYNKFKEEVTKNTIGTYVYDTKVGMDKLNKFWKVVENNISENENYLNILLEFMTGKPNLPIGGYEDYARKLSIEFDGAKARIAGSHTCFNQLILSYHVFDDNAQVNVEQAISIDVLKQGIAAGTVVYGGRQSMYHKYIKYKNKYINLKNKLNIK